MWRMVLFGRLGLAFVTLALCWLATGLSAADVADASPLTESEELSKLSLDDLLKVKVQTVYGASKYEQKTTEAPSSVTIVTKEDIQLFGYRTLAEILNSVRGFYVTSDRGYSFIGIRGVGRPGDFGGRVLINVNGHRLNDPVYDSAYSGQEFPLDVDLIERVEVIRGAGSSLYGNNAFFGIVNVITRQGANIGGNGLEASGSYGSFDAASGRFSFGRKFKNGVEALLSGTYYDCAGDRKLVFPEFRDTNGGVIRNFDGEIARNVFASVSYAGLTFEGLYGRRDKDLPTAAYGTLFGDKHTEILDERAYFELRYQHEFNAGWKMLARAYFDHCAFDGTYPYANDAASGPRAMLEKEKDVAHMLGGELQFSKAFVENHHLTLGLEGRDDFQVRMLDYITDPPATYTDNRTSPASFGVYAQDEYSFLKNLTLNVGLRFDYFTTFGATVNPRAALIYHPRQASTLKVLYGQAFRGPNAYESYYHDPYYLLNPNLKPETVRSYELVWEESVAKNYRVTGSLFYNQVQDLITQVDLASDASGGILSQYQNTAAVVVRGGEAELETNWGHGLRGRFSYTYADAVQQDTDVRLNNSPRHVGKAQLAVPLYREKVFAGLELQAMSDRTTVGGRKLGAFGVANVNFFGKELARNLEFSAGVYNVFDKKYSDPAGPDFVQDRIQRDRRTFRLKLTYRW